MGLFRVDDSLSWISVTDGRGKQDGKRLGLLLQFLFLLIVDFCPSFVMLWFFFVMLFLPTLCHGNTLSDISSFRTCLKAVVDKTEE